MTQRVVRLTPKPRKARPVPKLRVSLSFDLDEMEAFAKERQRASEGPAPVVPFIRPPSEPE